MREFAGIWVPLITPFAADGAVDGAGLAALVRSLAGAGVSGFVVCGTTGEPATLDDGEKELVLQTVLDNCSGLPIVMGVSGIAPADISEQLQSWGRFAIAGFLVSPPYYVRPPQRGIIEFYKEIAASTPQPLIVYDIPYRTAVQMELETMRTLARIPGICAVKDCGGDARKTQALIADGQLQVLAGEDNQIFTTLCQGGAGAIAASAHLHPQLFVAMYRAVRSGRWEEARKLHHALAPMIAALFVEPNPAPLKAVLASLDRIGATLRLPMAPASEQAANAARLAYASIDSMQERLK